MRLLEYEAKDILRAAHIPVPAGIVVSSKDTFIDAPVVLKSQVPIGGRGKAGGILVINSPDDVAPAIKKLLELPIKGYRPTTILAEEKLAIKAEYYLSLLVDRTDQVITLVANHNGGVEVEENDQDSFLKIVVGDTPDFDAIGQSLADYLDLPDQTFILQDLAERLYSCFTQNDALLIEINPLVLTTDNELVAGDCKMMLDDAATFRHDWQFEEKPVEANFVTLDPLGNVATTANGAGLAMATVDAVHEAGMKPTNFLDIGGGANTETLLAAFHRLGEYEHVKAIIINIFAGITRLDEVARAVVAASKQIDGLPPLFIRFAGTGFDEALPILQAENIPLLASLEECLIAAKKEVDRG